MIINDYGLRQLSCDQCGAETPTYDEDEFNKMIEAAKADGWKITRPDGQWQHICNECASQGGALAAARRKFGLGLG